MLLFWIKGLLATSFLIGERNFGANFVDRINLNHPWKTVCYGNLGCFNNGPPFFHLIDRPISLIPNSPDALDTIFELFTRRNRDNPITIPAHRRLVVPKLAFNSSVPTRIIVAGIVDNLLITTWVQISEGASPEQFHIIGHSLGSHIAGYAGQRIRNLGRITGLDPAGTFYRNAPSTVVLDWKDAKFADVIHTNPGIIGVAEYVQVWHVY